MVQTGRTHVWHSVSVERRARAKASPRRGLTTACKRRGTAYAPASLRLLPAPEAQRSAAALHESPPQRVTEHRKNYEVHGGTQPDGSDGEADCLLRCVEAWVALCADQPIAFNTSEAVHYASRTRFNEAQNTVFLGADALPGDGLDANARLSTLACLAPEFAHAERF